MAGKPPAECPDCGALSVRVTKVAPWNHDRGDEWVTQAECDECDEYQEWFD